MFCRRDRLSGEKPRQGVFGLFGVSGRVRGVRPRGFCPKKQSPGKTLREECGRFGIGGAGSRLGDRFGDRRGGGKSPVRGFCGKCAAGGGESRNRRKEAGRPGRGKGRFGRTRQTLTTPEAFTNLTFFGGVRRMCLKALQTVENNSDGSGVFLFRRSAGAIPGSAAGRGGNSGRFRIRS